MLEEREKNRDMEDGAAEVQQVLHQQHLPDDLIVHYILTKVPVKSVLQFKCVSKQWYSNLSSSHFAHLYSKSSSLCNFSSSTQFLIIQSGKSFYLFSHDDDNNDDEIVPDTYCNNSKTLFRLGIDFDVGMPEKLVLVGSCNGLVCLASVSDYFFHLWNPITRKFHKYSDTEFPVDSSSTLKRVSWGFGFVSDIDHYKVVRIVEFPTTLEIMVHVFSLKSNKWTRIADELYQDVFSLKSATYTSYVDSDRGGPYRWLPSAVYLKRGVLINETLYWIVSKTDGQGRKIVAFDLVCEEFATVDDLDLVSNETFEDRFLCNMGGCLSKCRGSFRSNGVNIHMLKYPGKVETLDMSGDLNFKWCHDLVGYKRTGMFFIMHIMSVLGLVDPNSIPMKYTPLITSERPLESHMANFVPSLTLPYSTWDRPDGLE